MAQQRRYGTRLKSCDRLLPSIEPALPLTAANLSMLESDPLRIDLQEPVHVDLRALLEAEKRLKTSNRRPWRPELGNARAHIYAQRVNSHLRIAENHQIPCPRRCGSVRWKLGQKAPCRSSCERNLKSNARRKRSGALHLVHQDMVLRGNGRRSPVPALKYKDELLEPMNCQEMKHKPPASTSKTNTEDVFAMEPQVLPGTGYPASAREERENSPAFKVYEKIGTPTPPPSPSRSVAQNLFSQQSKVLSDVDGPPAREERETSPAFYIRSMSKFGPSPPPPSRLMARHFFSEESGVFTGNDGVWQRQAAEKRRKTSSAPTNCQSRESTPISSPSKTSSMSCNQIVACRSRTNSKPEFSQRSPAVSSEGFQGSPDSSCSESFDEKFTQNSFSLPYSHSSDGESPKLHTGSGPTQIPVHMEEETSPAPEIRQELKRVWPESPSVIKANLALKLMQEAKDTWLYAKTLTEFREKSGYYEKRVPMVIIYENSELSAQASSIKKRRENVFASKRKVCPVAADPSQRPATNGKGKSSGFVMSQETQALRIVKRVSKTPELGERERSLPIACQYPNPSAESYRRPNPQTPSSSSNTRADDVSAIDSTEHLDDSDPSEIFSRNKMLDILRFTDMTPAPKPSPRQIEEQISLNNDISGLMAWLERPELSTPSPRPLPLKIQSKEEDETESYVEAILDEEWRTVKGKEIRHYKITREGKWDDRWMPETNICAETIRLWKEQKRAAEEERGFAAPKLLPSLKRKAHMASLLPVPSAIGLMNEKSPTPQNSQTVLPPTPQTPIMGGKADPQAMVELSSQKPQLRPTDPVRKKRKLTQVSRPCLKSLSTPPLSSIPARELSRPKQEHEFEAHIKPLPLQSNSSTGYTEPAREAKTQDLQSTPSGPANSGEEGPRRQWLSEILDSREWSLLSSSEIAPALPQMIGKKHKCTRSPSPSSTSREASVKSVKYVSFAERRNLCEPRLSDPSGLKESRRSLPEHLSQVNAKSSRPSSSEIPRDHFLLTPTAKLGQKRRASYSPKNAEQIPGKKSRSSKVQLLSPTPPSSSPAREERESTQESLPEAQTESTQFPRLIFSARRGQTHQIQSIGLFGEDIPERWQAVKTPTTQCPSETQTAPAPSLSRSSLGNWSAVNQVQTPTSISQSDVESTSIPSFPIPSTPIVVEKETILTQPPRSEPPPILPGALPRRQVITQKKASSLDRTIVKSITSHVPVSKIPAVVQKAAAPPLQTRVEPPPILPGALPKRRVIEQKKTASLPQVKAKPQLIRSVSRIEPAPILPPKRQTVLMKKATSISQTKVKTSLILLR